jgi:hypothetical protein
MIPRISEGQLSLGTITLCASRALGTNKAKDCVDTAHCLTTRQYVFKSGHRHKSMTIVYLLLDLMLSCLNQIVLGEAMRPNQELALSIIKRPNGS